MNIKRSYPIRLTSLSSIIILSLGIPCSTNLVLGATPPEVNHITQPENMNACGPHAAAMLESAQRSSKGKVTPKAHTQELAHYMTEKMLAENGNIGTTPDDLQKYLRQIGVTTKVVNVDNKKAFLDGHLKKGKAFYASLLLTGPDGQPAGHGVVVRVLDEKHVIIDDPNQPTAVIMTRETFMEQWTGRAMTYKRGVQVRLNQLLSKLLNVFNKDNK